jgi:hypothetical protein
MMYRKNVENNYSSFVTATVLYGNQQIAGRTFGYAFMSTLPPWFEHRAMEKNLLAAHKWADQTIAILKMHETRS